MANRKQSFKSLLWVLRLQYQTTRVALFWGIFFNIYDGLTGIVNTYAAAKLITSVTEVAFNNGSANTVYFWLLVILGLEVLRSILQSFNSIIRRRADQMLELAASERYYTKLYELSQEQFDDEEFNTIASRARDGLSQLWRVTNELTWSLSSLIGFTTAMLAIIFVAPLVGVLIAITVIPIAIIRARQNKSLDKANKRAEPVERVAWRTRWYLLDPQFMPEVRLINGFKQLVRTWHSSMSKYNDIIYEVERKNARFDAVSNLVGPIATFLANVYFFRLLVAGSIGLDKFIFLRGILDQAATSALSLALSIDQLHEISIDFGNFNEFYYTEPKIPSGSKEVKRPLTIEFKNVSFKYPGSSSLALKNVSFKIVPGSRLALVGENGAGKTTLIKLLLRQYLPTEGEIIVNGVNIKDVEEDSYYKELSILSQIFLIINHLTIRDNLTIGIDREIKDQEIFSALDMVGIKDFVQKLPNGLSQRLDSSFKDGSSMSGGQIQRLGVARSLLRSGDIMILDEPTSAVDAKAEFSIFNNIYKQHADRTTLIVSHRFSTVRKADKVIVMDKGKIIEYGSHEELMEHQGLYKEMFEIQAEGYR